MLRLMMTNGETQMPTIYTVFTGEVNRAFKSREQAAKYAREIAAESESGFDIDVTKIELPPLTLDLIIAMIDNEGGGYAQSQETVYTAKAKNMAANRARRDAPSAPPQQALRDGTLFEELHGRKIMRYPKEGGGTIYAVGGVGFNHLDEAREYVRRGAI